MNLIERAAERLEELQRAGVENARDEGKTTPAARRREPEAGNVGALRELSAEKPAAPSSRPQAARAPRRVELDLARLAAFSVMTPDAPRSSLADEFRVIKRPLLQNAAIQSAGPNKNANLIIVTSALPGEGKSFTAANLAMSIAMELERTVLLVDADVARPTLPRMLGLPEGEGLLDVLVNDSLDVGEVLIKTSIETLSILPSGTPHPHATELLASDAMHQLLQEMARRYSDRLIIFDSPPLLVTTEARVLASHMGQVVMVVQAGRTAQSDVVQALATIESAPIKLMVLNKGRSSGHGYGYGYGYGYGART